MLAVVNSPKIDHLNSFVIRTKALYKQVLKFFNLSLYVVDIVFT